MGELKEFPSAQRDEIQEKKIEALSKLPHWRGIIRSRNSIRQLPDIKVGEIFWVELDKKPYIISEIKEGKATIRALDENATISTGITIFEMNKSIISREELFDIRDENAIDQLQKNLGSWLEKNPNEFLLFFGRDLNYFSLFKQKEGLTVRLLLDVIASIGKLISMDFNEDAVEVWIRTDKSKAELLYLIPFDDAIIDA